MIDEAAIAALYERYGHALYRRCLSLVANPDDARELLQEIFLQFWRGRDRFEGRSSVFTYLYRIATNKAIDMLRRRTTAGAVVDEKHADERSGGGFGAERRAAALRELAELTVGLDEETLTIAVLAYVDGMTQDEVAAAMDLSRRTVGKKLKRFLEHTRGRVGDGLRQGLVAQPVEGTGTDGDTVP
ncbi:MAG: sigma-70 family RNA polymerase sigma factor [Deltaproteobacteria bacterium]|nr:sigma-70 family RNA polymerase sigma factor [Deltaproteobacteria bacterium]